MEIKFPPYVDYKFFYRYILGKIIRFGQESKEEFLTLNLQETEHMTPGVICDLLCSIKYVKSLRSLSIFIVFGGAYKLISYLWNAQFFLHTQGGELFQSDALGYYPSEKNDSKEKNTNKICRVNIPPFIEGEDRQLPGSTISLIQQQIYMLYMGEKANGMERYNLREPAELTSVFGQFVENAYVHSHEERSCGCYFTFQNYKKTGLNFACADIGIGLYDSIQYKVKKKQKALKLFSEDEIDKYGADIYKKDLMAILECIVYRIGESSSIDFGFPYIFNELIIKRDGEMAIHSGNTLLEVNRDFLSRFFTIKEEKRITEFNIEKMRELILNSEKKKELNHLGILRILSYEYPGVHLSVHIGGE